MPSGFQAASIRVMSNTMHPGSQPVSRCIMSGIQPTGIPHIGNFIGAIQNWTDVNQSEINMIISIVDLHAITLPQDPKVLRYSCI